VLDLNKALLYADARGEVARSRQRGYLALVDGILAGEGEGPLAPEPVQSRLVVAGRDPVAIDAVCAGLIGLDPERVPCVRQAFKVGELPLTSCRREDVSVVGDLLDGTGLGRICENPPFRFRPPSGWVGHVECPH
jgi:hypothetical protein